MHLVDVKVRKSEFYSDTDSLLKHALPTVEEDSSWLVFIADWYHKITSPPPCNTTVDLWAPQVWTVWDHLYTDYWMIHNGFNLWIQNCRYEVSTVKNIHDIQLHKGLAPLIPVLLKNQLQYDILKKAIQTEEILSVVARGWEWGEWVDYKEEQGNCLGWWKYLVGCLWYWW